MVSTAVGRRCCPLRFDCEGQEGRAFFAASPPADWVCYESPENGDLWWCNEATREWFFEWTRVTQ